MGNIQVEPIAEDLMHHIQRAKANRDRAVAKALEEAQPEWVQHEDGTVTWKERVYVMSGTGILFLFLFFLFYRISAALGRFSLLFKR